MKRAKALIWLLLSLVGYCTSQPNEAEAGSERQLLDLGKEFQVSAFSTTAQLDPTIAVLSSGDFVITWSNQRDGQDYDIYAQIFDSTGHSKSSEFLVNTHVSHNQQFPAVASLSHDHFVIAWSSEKQDTSGYGIFAQIFNGSGEKVLYEFQVNTYAPHNQIFPVIAAFSSGDFLIVWNSWLQDGSGYGIFAQRFNFSGYPLGVEFQVNTQTVWEQFAPAVSVFSTDAYIITWDSVKQDGSDYDIVGQRYSANASAEQSEFLLNTYTDNEQIRSAVATFSNGDFIVTWSSFEQDQSGYGVFAQRFSANGSVSGREFQVNTYTRDNQAYPDVAVLENDEFIITWESTGQAGDGFGIFTQRFDVSGAMLGPEFRINTNITTNNRLPSVIALNSSHYVIVWTSSDQSGSQFGIFFRFVAADFVTDAPSVVPTSFPTAVPTSSPTSPTSIPTAVPTSNPTSIPTSQPTVFVMEHIVVHLYDLHGDGWLDNLYLKVNHANGSDLYSLHCSCKVVRIFTGDVSLSLWRNRTVAGPKGDVMPYEWEALWTVGYSDGLTETDFGIVGDINTQVEIRNYALNSSQHAVDTNHSNPANMCIPPNLKSKAPNVTMNSTESEVASGTETEPASPTVDVVLALRITDEKSWCDDSGSTSVLACDKEHHLSTDAVLPNLVLYPRYYISRTDDNRVVASGTLREDVTEWVTSVKLLREGSYVFSVSGTYTASSGSVSWDFCGEQGGINERLHFNMVKGVCHSHYIEEVSGDFTCYEQAVGVETEGNLLPSKNILYIFHGVHFFLDSVPTLSLLLFALVMFSLAYFIVNVRQNARII